ncbi:MAG: glycosyltransferase [candidate division KSB1 bacterium]|nr:glycosyltransferase [candidate division KSB1 bacterium]
MSSEPFLSVIVPVFNRKDELVDLLASLEAQTLDKRCYEIIVVDDGSTDGTAEMLAKFQADSGLDLKVLTRERQGPGAARNAGMTAARGQVFVFIDSDCIAPPEWLGIIYDAFRTDEQLDAFGGRDDARADFAPLLLAINYSMTSFLTTGGMRGRKKSLAKFYPRSFNMGVRKRVVEKIGGFGSLRHGQDIEFSRRILKSGAKVALLEEAVVYHKRRTSLRKFFRQVFNWGAARINLAMIDRSMLEPLHAVPAVALWGFVLLTVSALFLPLAAKLWCFGFSAAVLLLLFSGIDAAVRYKNPIVGLLVPIVIPIQIFGYGLGFSIAWFRRVVLKQGEYTGFVKRYYH